jgi:hypothetical protein
MFLKRRKDGGFAFDLGVKGKYIQAYIHVCNVHLCKNIKEEVIIHFGYRPVTQQGRLILKRGIYHRGIFMTTFFVLRFMTRISIGRDVMLCPLNSKILEGVLYSIS